MNSKVGSLEEKVKLPPTETISRCYQPQGNRKVIRILTVAVYVLCVSLAAIMLSLYYIFIWDPTIRPFTTKGNNCDKIVIPEKIAIRLLNSSEVTAEQFYKHILEQYRILNHLQLQRQQFLQKQHLQLQQLAAANKFQEIFATATIIQANRNDIFNNKRVTPTNGTFLLEPRQPPPAAPAAAAAMTIEEQQQQQLIQLQQQQQQLQMQLQQQQQMAPILDTTKMHIKRKSHRKHYNSNSNNNNNSHHRHNTRKNHRKNSSSNSQSNNTNNIYNNNEEQEQDEQRQRYIESSEILKPPVTSVLNEQIFTPIPIPLILNTREEKRPHHHEHSVRNSSLQPRRRTTSSATSSTGYDTPTYINPFLTGELIFEK